MITSKCAFVKTALVVLIPYPVVFRYLRCGSSFLIISPGWWSNAKRWPSTTRDVSFFRSFPEINDVSMILAV
jgi:hypothetical protein